MIRAAIINDTGGTGHYGCDLVMDRLRDGMAKAGIVEAWSHPVGVDWRPMSDQLVSRPPIDVVIVNGEGSIHHPATRPRASFLPAIAPFARSHLGARAYLINSTIVDIDDAVASDLRAFDGIYVRESGSQRELRKYGIDSQVVLDLTVGAQLDTARERRGVCVTDSVVKEVAAELAFIAAEKGWTSRKMHEKRRGLKALISLFQTKPDFKDFARFLSSHELVVTGRFHTATMCIATKTPFVAIESNTPKISWLLDDVFGDRRRLIDPARLAMLRAEDFTPWTELERIAVDAATAKARRDAERMFVDISEANGA